MNFNRENIKNIILESQGNTYKLLCKDDKWEFQDIRTKNTYPHSFESVLSIVKKSRIIKMPNKIYELW